jgi:hypothetical protein
MSDSLRFELLLRFCFSLSGFNDGDGEDDDDNGGMAVCPTWEVSFLALCSDVARSASSANARDSPNVNTALLSALLSVIYLLNQFNCYLSCDQVSFRSPSCQWLALADLIGF